MASWENIDFSPLANLGRTYQDAQLRANRERTLAELGQGANINDVAQRLFQVGDVQGGMSLAQLANAQAQQEWTRTYQGGMLDVARQSANKDSPQIVDLGTPDGRKQKNIVNPSTGKATPLGSPVGDEIKLTAADRKAVFEAEDEIGNLKTTRDALARAKELAPKAFTGYWSDTRATIGNNLPDGLVPDVIASKAGSEATTELSQILSGESIANMSKTLKGATTDREMMEFKRIQADPNVPVKIKLAAIDRLMQKVDLQEKINTDRMNQLRGGTYFKQGGGMSSGPQAPGGLPRVNSPAEAARLPKGTRFIDPNGVERIVP